MSSQDRGSAATDQPNGVRRAGRIGTWDAFRRSTPIGAGLLALMVLLPGSGGAITVVPADHGYYSTGAGTGMSGCANSTVIAPPNYSLRAGHGSLGVLATQASTCAKSPDQGYARAGTGLFLEIDFRIPSGYHSVRPNLTVTWSVAGAISKSPGCPAPYPFNTSYSYAPPNSTYAYWENETGALSVCDAAIRAYANVASELVDRTNQSYFVPTFACHKTTFSCRIFARTTLNDSSTGWEFWSLVRYDQGVWNRTSGIYSFNGTDVTRAQSFHASGTARLAIDFNYTFVSGHQYELLFYFETRLSSEVNGWMRGHVRVSDNLGLGGNGVSLPNVWIT